MVKFSIYFLRLYEWCIFKKWTSCQRGLFFFSPFDIDLQM